MKHLHLFKRANFIGFISALLLTPFLLFSQPDPADIQQSIDDGLEWLVAQQDPSGYWYAYYGELEAGTGLALTKLCERAYELNYESPFDPAYPYSQNVVDGFDWLFDQLTVVPISPQDHTTGATGTIDDPDVNGNGTGVCALFNSYRETYASGILLSAIAASGTPTRVVSVPTSEVDGWTFADVAQDMVDFFAFGQVEYPVSGITNEGGWEYFHMDNGAYGSGWMGDQSNTGYAVLGIALAQKFGATIPDWVKTELNEFIDLVQDDVDDPVQPNDGGSWYSYPGDFIGINTLKTGNLLTEMALVGDLPTTQRVIDAVDYIERHWYDAGGGNQPPGWNGNPYGTAPAQYQAMFCLMKGLVYIGIDEFGGINWFDDIATVILAQQETAPGPNFGSWQSSSGRGEPVIITIWALLTLEKIAPNAPPEAICQDLTLSADEFCLADATAEDVDDGSFDPDGDDITLELTPPGPYPLGETAVTLTVTDEFDNSDDCTATITVVDDTDPVITAIAKPLTMWPPNHMYETFDMYDFVTAVADNCATGLTIDNVYFKSVSSDEPEDENGNGDGKTLNDMVIADDCKSIQLRKERRGNHNGRFYTVYLGLDDGNGNTSEAICHVTVQHNQGNPAINDDAVYWVYGPCDDTEQGTKSAIASATAFELINYPNPFDGTTTIAFTVNNPVDVVLKVYNAQGVEVSVLYSGFAAAGHEYTTDFNGNNLPKGVYFTVLQSEDRVLGVNKMLLMK